jgi:hypothetical protein
MSSKGAKYEAEDFAKYEVICETRLFYGAEIWATEEGWVEIDMVQASFCKKVLRIARCDVKGVAELELGRESRRGKIIPLVA